ncbi:MAG: TetR family transcriptional regulator [Solirubrobacterales bacterium]|nr:TetR family transcriptional regulator [Solirubrobacterales bacterium]
MLAAATPTPTEPDPALDAVADAALRQFELFGVTRSTMEQISRRAKIARVTLYRRFPGKDALVEAVMLRELRRFLAELDRVVKPLDDPEERLVDGFVFTLEAIRGHRLLQRLLESEPEAILPHLTTQGAPFVTAAREFLAARLAGDLEDDRTPAELVAVADVVVRLLLSYLLTPQAPVDLDDHETARAFALRYLRPILIGDGA